MSIRESNSRTFLREAGLDDWFGVIPAVVEFRRFPGEPSEQLRKRRVLLHFHAQVAHPGVIQRFAAAVVDLRAGRLSVPDRRLEAPRPK